MTWLSYPVLDLRPHYDDPALITGRDLTFARRGFGQVTPWANQPNAQRTLALPFVLIGKAQIAAFRRFFDSLAGRAGLFWIPAYQNAMALRSDVSAEAGNLTCGDTGLADRLPQHPGYIHAALVSATALQPFQIESVTVSDGAMIVSSTEIIGQEFVAASTMVSWLMLVRLQADELAFTYLTDALALVALNCIEVPREYPTL